MSQTIPHAGGNNMEDVSFGRWMQRRRRSLLLTQAQLADQAACSTAAIRKFEADERRPSRDIAEHLAHVLDIPEPQRLAFVHFARGEHNSFMQDEPPAAAPTPTLPQSNLPAPLTVLIGREHEVAAVVALLRQPGVRLVTLTGPGGVGKTRLSLAVADALRFTFADGIYVVALAPICDPALVLPTIAETLAVKDSGGQPLLTILQAYLHDKQMLLVVDNVEHLVGAGPQLAELLQHVPSLQVLVTSRMPLRVRGEREVAVTPLAVPTGPSTSASLAQNAAAQLFIERAKSVKADFVVTDATAPAVADICARLDGLPLAIELAAARVKVLPPTMLVQRLTEQVPGRLELLTGGAQDLPHRQQTLRGTIDWSYRLLDGDEQLLFSRLAVFAGGATLETVEAVCPIDGDLPTDLLDAVTSLVTKSLVWQIEDPDDEPRFGMLETIRAYALEQLDAGSWAAPVRQRHALYFIGIAERAEPAMQGAHQVAWLHRLEREHHNLRAALRWVLDQGEADLALRLSGALGRFWRVRGHLREGQRWLEQALRPPSNVPGAVSAAFRAKALAAVGSLVFFQGAYAQAVTLVEESLRLYRDLEDQRGIADTLSDLGSIAEAEGDYARMAWLLEESLRRYRDLEDQRGIASVLTTLGDAALTQGDAAGAITLYEESLPLFRAGGDQAGIAWVLGNLGDAMLDCGDAARAIALYKESLALYWELGDHDSVAEALATVAGVASSLESSLRSAWLFGAAEAVRDMLGAPLTPVDQGAYDDTVAQIRAQVDEVEWTAAWAEGRSTSLTHAVAQALTILDELATVMLPPQQAALPTTPTVASGLPGSLSEREIEVLRLVADGLTYAQVADQLYISPHTVNAHLRTIYSKLGVTSRTAATRFALEHHLL